MEVYMSPDEMEYLAGMNRPLPPAIKPGEIVARYRESCRAEVEKAISTINGQLSLRFRGVPVIVEIDLSADALNETATHFRQAGWQVEFRSGPRNESGLEFSLAPSKAKVALRPVSVGLDQDNIN
jgi:hypothetical protein